jgi:hypothetical protein
MLTDVGQVRTKVWICKNVDWTSVRPFFAKPNVMGSTVKLIINVKNKNYAN